MGAGWSAATGLHVQCDKAEYVAGDTVRAIVALNVVKPIELESVELQLVGSEHTVYGGRKYKRDSTVVFLRSKLALTSAPGTFAAGQYQWSLAFNLPPNLPGILRLEPIMDNWLRWGRGQLKYELQATGHTKGAMKRALRSQPYFLRVLAAPPTAAPVPVEHSMDFFQGCCCFSGGTITARLALDRDWVLRGEEVGVTVEVDNQSSYKVECLVVSLWEALDMTDVPGTFYQPFKVQQGVSPEAQLAGVPAHSSAQGKQARHIQLRIPGHVQPSTAGRLLRLSHHVHLTLHAGGCATAMQLKAPLRVFIPRHAAAAAAPAAPAGPAEGQPPFLAEPPPFWKPQTVHEPAAWEVPDAPPLPKEALRADATFFVKSTSNAER